MPRGAKAHIWERKSLNEEWIARSIRTLLQKVTFSGVVQPGGVHTSTCLIYCVMEWKGRVKIVHLRGEPFAHSFSWKRREVPRSPVYRRLREPFAETEKRFEGIEESILSHRRRHALTTSIFVSPWLQDAGNTIRCKVLRTKLYAKGPEC